MSSRLIYGAVLFVAFYCVSCKCSTKTIDCPGYDGKEIENWFVYSDNQVLSFKTSSGEQRTLNIKKTFTSEPYQATSTWGGSVSCNAEQRFESAEKDAQNYPNLGLTFNEGDGFRSSFAQLYRTSLQFDQITKDTITAIRIDYNNTQMLFKNTALLDNKSFSNVFEATRDTLDKKQTGIYKIYIAKQQGIVGYAEYPSLKLWVKQ